MPGAIRIRRMRLSVASLTIALLAALLLLSGIAAAQQPQRGGTLNIGVDQEAVGLDPTLVTAFSSFWRIELLYNGLVRYDSHGAIEPDLADCWDVVDPTTYVFHLRQGVKFHNGRELTADDVKYTIDRILDPATGSPARSYLTSVEEVNVLDRYTVEFRLSEPLASLLDSLTSRNIAIVPREEVEAEGNLQRTAVGTGPFRLAEWVPDNYMRLERNPEYFREGLPYLDEVVFRVIPEQASLLAGLRSGSLDLVALSEGSLIRVASADPRIEMLQSPSLNTRTFGYNVTREPFDNVKVRQALSLAIDVDEVIAAAELGLGFATGPVPVSSEVWAVSPADLPYYKHDPERARELLAEAGYPNGFTMKIVTSPTYEGGLAVAQVIQDQLRDIGVNAELDVVEWGMYVDRWVNYDFDSMVELRGGGGDPEVDRLLEAGRQKVDQAERQEIYRVLQERIAELSPMRALYAVMETRAMRSDVRGFQLTPTGSYQYVESTWLNR